MANALLGRKLGMTQIFTEDGTRVACTVLELGPCQVTRIKTADSNDGYNAVQIGFEDIAERKLTKPQIGVFKGLKMAPKRFLRELRVDAETLKGYEAGQELNVDAFKLGDFIDVTATSKGRGFAGVMKRHNFRGAKRTHGVHEYFRHGGSIGMCAWPGKVIKGQKMAGQYGNKRTTIQNLSVMRIHADMNLMLVKGAVPGPNHGLVFVRNAKKKAQ